MNNTNAFFTLEFNVIRERLSRCAKSACAEQFLLEDIPLSNENELKNIRENILYIYNRFSSSDKEPSGFLPDIRALLSHLSVVDYGLALDEVYALFVFIEESFLLLKWLKKPAAPQEVVFSRNAIFSIIDKDGNMRELPVLLEIKKRIAFIEKELAHLIKSYYSDNKINSYLQSDLPSERDGRVVIAIKANHKNKIKGIVREVSATGQTFFIEPEAVVEKNNALLIEKRNYEIEVNKILKELTEKLREKQYALNYFHDEIIQLDIYRAKAKFSFQTKSAFAAFSKNNSIILKEARHPLLGDKAVPVNFEMSENCHCTIVSGPNTGGKTVLLKTAGLFALMNQLGLSIPAADGSELPVFDSIFTDIGDDQSITESLSTFSAHIKNISLIACNATEKSLVLLDELCSGTDPIEGGAIAMAVADFFVQKRIKTLIATHHGVLKNYAACRAGAENASVEFDEDALLPSYRVIKGVPGESRALLIAERNNLPPFIIKKAKEYISSQDADVSELIKQLTAKSYELDAARNELELKIKTLAEEKRKTDLHELRLRQKESEIKKGQIGSINRFLSESRKELENLVRELREGEITREKTLAVKEFISRLQISAQKESENNEEIEVVDNSYTENTAPEKDSAENTAKINAGTVVRVGARRLNGIVKRKVKEGFYAVETGSVTVTLPESELFPIEASAPAPSINIDIAGNAAPLELNLRGMRAVDALSALSAQIDAALIQGLREFAVIHGKGDGILSAKVREYLSSRGEIDSFQFSRPEHGGYGRTEVRLKV